MLKQIIPSLAAKAAPFSAHARNLASHAKPKKEGDISSVFVSLSGAEANQLPERYVDIKRGLVRGNEDRIIASWKRLLHELQSENEIIAREGSKVVPQIDFEDLKSAPSWFHDEVKKRGVAVVRGVIPENEARQYKTDVEEYVTANPWTKGTIFDSVSHDRISST